MISLMSNGRLAVANPEWCGVDAAEIRYPAVSTCITVTCIAGGKLVGAHLFYLNTNDVTTTDLETFGALARSQGLVNWVGVVGMIDYWTTGCARNRTGYLTDDGTLFAKLRTVLGYVGGIATYNATAQGEIDLLAQKTKGNYVQYSFTTGEGAPTFINYSDLTITI